MLTKAPEACNFHQELLRATEAGCLRHQLTRTIEANAIMEMVSQSAALTIRDQSTNYFLDFQLRTLQNKLSPRFNSASSNSSTCNIATAEKSGSFNFYDHRHFSKMSEFSAWGLRRAQNTTTRMISR